MPFTHMISIFIMHVKRSLTLPFSTAAAAATTTLCMLFFIVSKLLTFRVIHEMFGMYDFIELCFCRLCSMDDERST